MTPDEWPNPIRLQCDDDMGWYIASGMPVPPLEVQRAIKAILPPPVRGGRLDIIRGEIVCCEGVSL